MISSGRKGPVPLAGPLPLRSAAITVSSELLPESQRKLCADLARSSDYQYFIQRNVFLVKGYF
jgi:hypothetical protein